MKPKINLSGDGIKSFFFNSGEKLVLGLTVLVLFYFLYGAVTAKPLDDSKSPRAISSKATEKQGVVQSSGNPPPTDFPPVDDRDPVPAPAPYEAVQQKWEINPPIFKELHLRTEPEFFPVESIQVAAEVGIVPYQPPAGQIGGGAIPQPMIPQPQRPANVGHDEVGPARRPLVAPFGGGGVGVVGGAAPAAPTAIAGIAAYGTRAPGMDAQPKGMAVITGLIPYEKQCEAYRREFEYALPAGQVDLPAYQFFNIQRAEVKDGADANFNWQSVPYKAALDETQKWGVPPPTPELADPQHVCPPAQLLVPTAAGTQSFTTFVTWPLPPMYLKNWGPSAVHLKVPLFKAPEVAAAVDANPAQNIDLNAATPALTPGATQGMAGMPVAGAAGQTPAPEIVNKLFRFVDLTAVPGKTYRYRVQLLLANPNYINPLATQGATGQLAERHLAKPLIGKVARRESPWSEPSPAITIPSVHRILADSVAIAGGKGAEPKAKVNILRIVNYKEPANAVAAPAPAAAPALAGAAVAGAAPTNSVWLEVMKDTEVLLGGVAYLEGAAMKAFDPTIEQSRNLTGVTLDTNQSTLLDVRNDDPLGAASRSKGPAEMLFFEPRTGKLIAVNSGADSAVKTLYKDRTTPAEGTGGAIPMVIPGGPAVPAPGVPVPPGAGRMPRRGEG